LSLIFFVPFREPKNKNARFFCAFPNKKFAQHCVDENQKRNKKQQNAPKTINKK